MLLSNDQYCTLWEGDEAREVGEGSGKAASMRHHAAEESDGLQLVGVVGTGNGGSRGQCGVVRLEKPKHFVNVLVTALNRLAAYNDFCLLQFLFSSKAPQDSSPLYKRLSTNIHKPLPYLVPTSCVKPPSHPRFLELSDSAPLKWPLRDDRNKKHIPEQAGSKRRRTYSQVENV